MSSEIVTARLRPLNGKHYGTDVLVRHPNGRTTAITVWLPIGPPSDAELADWNVDRSMYESNVEVPDGWGGWVPIQSEFPCDNHYQSAFEAEVAQRIVDALDGMVWDG